MNKIKKKNKSVRSIRMSDALWEEIQLRRFFTNLSWSKLLKRMLDADKKLNNQWRSKYDA